MSPPCILGRRAKKECNEHFSWEKLRRAELDMDRVRQWLKLDELLEKERQASLPWGAQRRAKIRGGWGGGASEGIGCVSVKFPVQTALSDL